MTDDTWPAVFFHYECDSPLNRSDLIEVPVGCTFLLDFFSLTTNVVSSGEAPDVTVFIIIDQVPVFLYEITGSTFFGGSTIAEPLQGHVIPQQTKFNVQVQWNPAVTGFFLSVHLAGRITARPPYVGIFEQGSFIP